MTKRGVALLIFCATYTSKGPTGVSLLGNLPQAEHSMRRLDAFIRRRKGEGIYDIDFADNDIYTVEDPEGNKPINDAILALPETADFLLIYYCGHGLRSKDGKLHFGVGSSQPDAELVPASAYPVEAINSQIRGRLAQIPQKLIIYDCCHGGAGINHYQQMGAEEVEKAADEAFFEEEDLAADVKGTVYWAASAAHRKALAHKKWSPFTLFTDELLNVMEDGIEGAGGVLTSKQVIEAVKTKIEEKRKRFGYPLLPDPISREFIEGRESMPLVANRQLLAVRKLIDTIRKNRGGDFRVTEDNIESIARQIVEYISNNSETRSDFDSAAAARMYEDNKYIGVALFTIRVPKDLTEANYSPEKVRFTTEYMNELCLRIYGYDQRPKKEFKYNEVPLEIYYKWMSDADSRRLKIDQNRIIKALALGGGSTAARRPLVFNHTHDVPSMQGRTYFPVWLSVRQVETDETDSISIALIGLVSADLANQFGITVRGSHIEIRRGEKSELKT